MTEHSQMTIGMCLCVQAWSVSRSAINKTAESKPIEIKHRINSKLMFIKMSCISAWLPFGPLVFMHYWLRPTPKKKPRITRMHGLGECEFNKQMSYNLMTNGFDATNDRKCYIRTISMTEWSTMLLNVMGTSVTASETVTWIYVGHFVFRMKNSDLFRLHINSSSKWNRGFSLFFIISQEIVTLIWNSMIICVLF